MYPYFDIRIFSPHKAWEYPSQKNLSLNDHSQIKQSLIKRSQIHQSQKEY